MIALPGPIFVPAILCGNVQKLIFLLPRKFKGVVGAGLCDGDGERAYTAYAPPFDIFAFRKPFSKQE